MSTDSGRGKPTARVEIDRGLVAVNALSTALTHAVSLGILLWVNHYLLHRLSAEAYAPFPIVVALFLFLQVVTSVLTGGITRYVTEAYAKAELKRVTTIVSSMFPLILVSVLIFWLVGGLLAVNVDQVLAIAPDQVGEAQLMFGLMVFGHGIVMLAAPFSVGLQVRQKFVWLNAIKLGEQALRLGLLLVLLFGVSTSVHWVVVATQAALVTATVVTVLVSRRLIPELRFEVGAWNRSTLKQLSGFGGWMMLGSLIYRIRTSADVLILNRFATAVDVNAFHVGRLPDRHMDSMLILVSSTLQPALIAMHAADREESLRRAYLRGNRYYLWATLAVGVPLFAFAEELVVLYAGEIYLLAATVLKLKCAAYPLQYASQMLYLVCMAKARIRTFFTIVSVAAVAQMAGAVILVDHYGLGAAGVAWSGFAVTVLAHVLFLWPLGLRLLKLDVTRFVRETLLPGYLPAAGALAAAYELRAALEPETWLDITAGVALSLLVYAALVAVFSAAEDRKDVALLIRHVKARVGISPAPRTGTSG